MELPRYLQIEPAGQCNLRCQMCSIQFRRDGPPHGPLAFMEFERFTNIVDQFEGLEELPLQGLGEPMMHPRFWNMIAYAAARGVKVTTNSNLTLINSRRADLCVTSGLDCLHVSIDGSTAETYERIRDRAHYDKVIRNLRLLLEARERHGTDRPRLRLVMVVMRQNLHELPDLVRFARQWTFEGMFVQHLCHDFGESSLPEHYRPMREFVEDQTLLNEKPERVERYFDEARGVAARLGVELRLPRTVPRPHAADVPGKDRCSWPWTGAYVSFEGLAMPCCMVSTPDRINFGNMAEKGVRAVWNDEKFETFREQLASDTPPEICKSCAVYNGTF